MFGLSRPPPPSPFRPMSEGGSVRITETVRVFGDKKEIKINKVFNQKFKKEKE